MRHFCRPSAVEYMKLVKESSDGFPRFSSFTLHTAKEAKMVRPVLLPQSVALHYVVFKNTVDHLTKIVFPKRTAYCLGAAVLGNDFC